MNEDTPVPNADIPTLTDIEAQAQAATTARAALPDTGLPPTETQAITLETKPATAVAPPATPLGQDGALPPPLRQDVAIAPPATPVGAAAPVQDQRDVLDKQVLRDRLARNDTNPVPCPDPLIFPAVAAAEAGDAVNNDEPPESQQEPTP